MPRRDGASVGGTRPKAPASSLESARQEPARTLIELDEQTRGGMTTPNAPAPEVDPIRVTRQARMVEKVLTRLREAILSHEIPPGERLLQIDLADRMGVSRTPLREAFRLLEQDGLVRVSNGNRTIEVVHLTGKDLADHYDLREMIDGLAARLLARRGLDDLARRTLRDHLDTMRSALEPFDGQSYFVAHVNFHCAIIEHCDNAPLLRQLPLVRLTAASLRDEFPRVVRPSSQTTAADARRNARLAQDSHEAIFDAIDRGDEGAAEKAAREHIAVARTYFPEE
jgi:GntR family transcriptional regulator of vanillate catabolism